MKKTGIIALFLTFVLLLTTAPSEPVFSMTQNNGGLLVDETELLVPALDPEVGVEEIAEIMGSPIETEIKNNRALLQNGRFQLSQALPETSEKEALPAKYPADPLSYFPTLPDVRSQSSNTCWAFSTIAATELSLIKEGKADQSIDLSERHLVRFSYGRGTNPILSAQAVTDDALNYSGTVGEGDILAIGGNPVTAGNALMRRQGAALETTAPFNGAKVNDLTQPSFWDNVERENAYTVTGYYMLDIKENPDLVKWWVKTYGGATLMYYDNNAYFRSADSLYRCTNSSITDDNLNTWVDHAVTIIGWDDEIGAWLVRNSWGGSSTNYSYDSYFWMAYDSRGIWPKVYGFTAEPVSETLCENNYYYDSQLHDTGWITGVTYMSSNVFPLTATGASIYETIRSVIFDFRMTESKPVKTEIRICGVKDDGSPDETKLYSKTVKKLAFTGKYQVDLDKPVNLRKGSKVAVIVAPSSGNIIMEKNYSNAKVCVSSKVNCNPGESFYRSSYQNGWKDTLSLKWSTYGNFCIGMLTQNSDDPVVTEPETAGILIKTSGVSLNQISLSMKPSQTAHLTAVVKPSNATNKNLIWSSENENVVTVSTSGAVHAVSAGEANIIVETDDGGQTASCLVTVKEDSDPTPTPDPKPEPETIKAEKVEIENVPTSYLKVGTTVKLTAKVFPENATDKEVIWKSENDFAEVSSNGIVTGMEPGIAVISARTKDGNAFSECKILVVADLPDSVLQKIVPDKPYSAEADKPVSAAPKIVTPSAVKSGSIRIYTPVSWKNAVNYTGAKIDPAKHLDASVDLSTLDKAIQRKNGVTASIEDLVQVKWVVSGKNKGKNTFYAKLSVKNAAKSALKKSERTKLNNLVKKLNKNLKKKKCAFTINKRSLTDGTLSVKVQMKNNSSIKLKKNKIAKVNYVKLNTTVLVNGKETKKTITLKNGTDCTVTCLDAASGLVKITAKKKTNFTGSVITYVVK